MRLPTLVLDRLRVERTAPEPRGEAAAPAAAPTDRRAAGPDPSDLLADFLPGSNLVDLAAHRAARRRGGLAWTI